MNPVEPIRNPVGLSSLWTDYEHGLLSQDAGVIIIFRAKRPKSDPVCENTTMFRNVGVTVYPATQLNITYGLRYSQTSL